MLPIAEKLPDKIDLSGKITDKISLSGDLSGKLPIIEAYISKMIVPEGDNKNRPLQASWK